MVCYDLVQSRSAFLEPFFRPPVISFRPDRLSCRLSRADRLRPQGFARPAAFRRGGNAERELAVVGRAPFKEFQGAEEWIIGNYAYYSTVADRFLVYDISDPAHPKLTDTVKVDARLVNDISTTPDGKILVGGGDWDELSVQHARIMRLNADGTVDASFREAVGRADAPVLVDQEGGQNQRDEHR